MEWVPSMTESEAVVLGLIAGGVLRIDDNGAIWRIKTRTRTGRLRTLPEPTRADRLRDDGYRRVHVSVEGREISAAANRIVWMVTNRRSLPDGVEVNHEDGVRSNNRPSNLTPMTKGQNLSHSYQVLNRWRPSGERCKRGKLTAAQVAEIRSRRARGDRVTDLAADFGVTRQTIRRIAVGETWRDQYPAAVTHA